MNKSKNYNDLLIKSLKKPQEAIAYLNAALEECKDGSEESQKLLLMALKNVALAQGGITQLSTKTGLGRESLYKTLSKKGNPKLTTLTTLISAMGFDLKISLPSKR
jgi:probable addiction module antidote protein